MTLRLYDTASREKRDFVPADPKRVTMYVCGPTVYNFAHIGNARPAVVFDVLFRLLRRTFGANHVIYARNVTDVDDKINAKAAEEGVPIAEIAERYAEIYNDDMRALWVLNPTIEPRATQHMPQIIGMIERLTAAGHAYEAEGHVLFSVPSFPDYGALSRRDRDEMIAGARVDVAPYKKDPADFVLWKPAGEGTPGWDSPWGRGRPGWHIECSAMIETNLGETIDIHGGGLDLVFPHHENEIAQSVCAHHGAPFTRVWIHNGMLNMASEKMSKSTGNVALISTLRQRWDGEALRLALLSAHYRQPLEWSDHTPAQAKTVLDRAYTALRRLKDVEATPGLRAEGVIAALEDDLNTPRALAELSALIGAANTAEGGPAQAQAKARLLDAGVALGLLQHDPEAWFTGGAAGEDADMFSVQEIEKLIARRNDARARRDFAEADRIRDALGEQGVLLEDGAEGTIWKRG